MFAQRHQHRKAAFRCIAAYSVGSCSAHFDSSYREWEDVGIWHALFCFFCLVWSFALAKSICAWNSPIGLFHPFQKMTIGTTTMSFLAPCAKNSNLVFCGMHRTTNEFDSCFTSLEFQMLWPSCSQKIFEFAHCSSFGAEVAKNEWWWHHVRVAVKQNWESSHWHCIAETQFSTYAKQWQMWLCGLTPWHCLWLWSQCKTVSKFDSNGWCTHLLSKSNKHGESCKHECHMRLEAHNTSCVWDGKNHCTNTVALWGT